MEIIKFEVKENILTVGFKDFDKNYNSFVVYTDIFNDNNLSEKELLNKAYLQCKDSIEYEKTLEYHALDFEEDGEEFELQDSKATKLLIDFENLKGKILDQYENEINQEILFYVEGTDKAKIQDNKIIEDSVKEDTEYFIVAKYLDLIEKQKKIIYANKPIKIYVNDDAVKAFEAIAGLDERLSNLEKKVN